MAIRQLIFGALTLVWLIPSVEAAQGEGLVGFLRSARERQLDGRVGLERARVEIETESAGVLNDRTVVDVHAEWVGVPIRAFAESRKESTQAQQQERGSDVSMVVSTWAMQRRSDDTTVVYVMSQVGDATHRLVVYDDLTRLEGRALWSAVSLADGLHTSRLWGVLQDGRFVLDALAGSDPDLRDGIQIVSSETTPQGMLKLTLQLDEYESASVMLDPARGGAFTRLTMSRQVDHAFRSAGYDQMTGMDIPAIVDPSPRIERVLETYEIVVAEFVETDGVTVPMSGWFEVRRQRAEEIVWRQRQDIRRTQVDLSVRGARFPLSIDDIPDGTAVALREVSDPLPREWRGGRVEIAVDPDLLITVEDMARGGRVEGTQVAEINGNRSGWLVPWVAVAAGLSICLVMTSLLVLIRSLRLPPREGPS